MMIAQSVCGICGEVVLSRVPSGWHPSKLERRAQTDLDAHVKMHTFAEVLRYEIRRDLERVPEEERPTVLRDVYRHLLGTISDGAFRLKDEDSVAAFSIEEALGAAAMYRLWQAAVRCSDPSCPHQAG